MTDSRKQILMISDFLGRVTNIQSNHRIVIYDDGSVEKLYQIK